MVWLVLLGLSAAAATVRVHPENMSAQEVHDIVQEEVRRLQDEMTEAQITRFEPPAAGDIDRAVHALVRSGVHERVGATLPGEGEEHERHPGAGGMRTRYDVTRFPSRGVVDVAIVA